MEITIQLKLSLILIAACSSFLLGGLWYGPLFGKACHRSLGANAEALAGRSMRKVFVAAFLLALVVATTMSVFLGPEPALTHGLLMGFGAGIGWLIPLLAILYLFEARPAAAVFINGGYCTLALTLIGAILTF